MAKEGNDRVYADAGFDVICGGPGRDRLVGGPGEDRIFGNRGKDILWGGSGFDRLNGGKSLDACYPGAGGGDVVDCEDADLRVTIFSPSSAFTIFTAFDDVQMTSDSAFTSAEQLM